MTDSRENTVAKPASKNGVLSRLTSWLLPALLVVYAKGKVLLLFLLKSAIFAPIFSFLASWGAYGIWLGWAAGFGLMIHLLVHELGHYLTAKQMRLQVALPKFMPFIGAWVSHEDPRCDYKNALIALGGPTAGLLLSVICLAIWHFFDSTSHFWLWMAATGFLLNLSNLLPMNPLDGGHVVSKIAPRLVALAPYAVAVIAPAFGDDQTTSIVIFLLFSTGLMSNKTLQLCLAAGIAIGAFVAASYWGLLGAAFFAFLATGLPVRYATMGWNAFFSLILHGKVDFGKPDELENTTSEAVVVDADISSSSPLTMPQRIGIGAWYLGLLVAGCPVGFWLFKLLGAQSH